MEIIHTTPYMSPESGGPSRSVPELCLGLVNLGQDVRIVSTYVPNRDKVDLWFHSEQLKTHYISSKLSFNQWAWTPDFSHELSKLLRHAKKPIVHDHGLWLQIHHATKQAASSAGCSLILSPRGMLETWSMRFHRLRKQIAWRLYQHKILQSVHLFHATSEVEVTNIRKAGLKQPIALIPNGVNIRNAELRPNHLPVKRTRNVLFLSRIHPKKGLLNLVTAMSHISAENWHVQIAGPDENGHRSEVEQAIINAGLRHAFTFLGPVQDSRKWSVYKQADLFILPTFSENFGIVVAEALACGVPVITTTGTPWQELQSHKCGWWVDPTVDSIANALSEAIALSDGERHEMGLRGRKLVAERYTWPKIAESMLESYNFILNQPSTPPRFMHL